MTKIPLPQFLYAAREYATTYVDYATAGDAGPFKVVGRRTNLAEVPNDEAAQARYNKLRDKFCRAVMKSEHPGHAGDASAFLNLRPDFKTCGKPLTGAEIFSVVAPFGYQQFNCLMDEVFRSNIFRMGGRAEREPSHYLALLSAYPQLTRGDIGRVSTMCQIETLAFADYGKNKTTREGLHRDLTSGIMQKYNSGRKSLPPLFMLLKGMGGLPQDVTSIIKRVLIWLYNLNYPDVRKPDALGKTV